MSIPLATDDQQDPIGSTINSYRLVRLIGRGGMGAVYEARLIDNKSSGAAERVAIKMLRERAPPSDTSIINRFINEARSTARVQHPGLVRVLDYGQVGNDQVYIMMEYLDGTLLRERIRSQGRLSYQESCVLSAQIADAMAAAHDQGIVHRDLKPDNVMLVSVAEGGKGGERVKVLDFGLAKIVVSSGMDTLPGYKTTTGALMGTPTYMSPEQCRAAGIQLDDRSDVYSLGVMLFEMLTGAPPFKSAAPGELIAMHIIEPPPELAPLCPEAPQELFSLAARMLAKKPAERPAMREVSALLSALADAPPTVYQEVPLTIPLQAIGPEPAAAPAVPSRRRRTTGLALGAGACLLFVLLLTLRERRPVPEKPRSTALPPAPPGALATTKAPASPLSAPIPSPPQGPLPAREPGAAAAASVPAAPPRESPPAKGKRRSQHVRKVPARSPHSNPASELDVPAVY